MQIEEYKLHYELFHKEFAPKAGKIEKAFKLACECREFIESYTDNEPNRENDIDEAIDVMNTAIAYLVSEGIHDPLDAGCMKLWKTAEKYRKEGK